MGLCLGDFGLCGNLLDDALGLVSVFVCCLALFCCLFVLGCALWGRNSVVISLFLLDLVVIRLCLYGYV